MEVVKMKTCKPFAAIKRTQSLPPHIPREMPAIYQILEGIEEGVNLLKKAVSRKLQKGYKA